MSEPSCGTSNTKSDQKLGLTLQAGDYKISCAKDLQIKEGGVNYKGIEFVFQVLLPQFREGILRGMKFYDELIYLPNDYKQYNPFCRLKKCLQNLEFNSLESTY